MSKYPELFKLQIECYKSLSIDWKEIARKNIFQKTPIFLLAIENTRNLLNQIIP